MFSSFNLLEPVQSMFLSENELM